jgi:hypothetical protein
MAPKWSLASAIDQTTQPANTQNSSITHKHTESSIYSSLSTYVSRDFIEHLNLLGCRHTQRQMMGLNKSVEFLQNQGLSTTQINGQSVEAGRGVQSKCLVHVD